MRRDGEGEAGRRERERGEGERERESPLFYTLCFTFSVSSSSITPGGVDVLSCCHYNYVGQRSTSETVNDPFQTATIAFCCQKEGINKPETEVIGSGKTSQVLTQLTFGQTTICDCCIHDTIQAVIHFISIGTKQNREGA